MDHGEPGTKDRILKSALDLFSTKGYDGTSVREICEAAGIAKPSLYHFYRSKEGVYQALVDETLASYRSELLEELGRPGTVAERLEGVAQAYFRAARENPDLMRFIFGLVHQVPSSAPATGIARFYQEMVGLIAALVDEGVRSGELSPGSTDARMLVFMGALGESVVGSLVLGRPDLTPDLAHAVVDALLRGWLPPARP